jgi:hypothetical protein
VYIGQTILSIKTRVKELPVQSPWTTQPVSGHRVQLQHIQLQDTKVLSIKSCYMDYIIREVIKTELHTNIINREDNLVFSRSQKTLIHCLRERRRRLLQDGQFFTALFGHNVHVLY